MAAISDIRKKMSANLNLKIQKQNEINDKEKKNGAKKFQRDPRNNAKTRNLYKEDLLDHSH